MEYFQSFGTSEDYHELNSGPHRRNIIALRPPMICWHLCFWAPEPAGIDVEVKRDETRDKVDDFIVELYRHLKQMEVDSLESKSKINNLHSVETASKIGDKLILFNNVFESDQLVRFPKIKKGKKYIVNDEKNPLNRRQHDVFESIYRDIVISFKWKSSKIWLRFELNTEYFTVSAFVQLDLENKKILELYDTLKEDPQPTADSETTKQTSTLELRDHLYVRFWEDFKQTFFMTEKHKALHLFEKGAIEPFAMAFADFRGLVISQESKVFESASNGDWGTSAVEHFEDVIATKYQGKRYEVAANYLLDRRAIYMSTLGPQNPTQDDAQRIPVFYLVYVTPEVQEFELGRLLLCIHLLGSVRLASLRRLKSLLKAGEVLSQLEPVVKDARAMIPKEDPAAAIQKITEANKVFDRINETDSVLLYRIERSRYYSDQFAKNLKHLAIDVIEGFQPYDLFVRWRMGAALDYIDRLGRRYDRATANLSLLQQYFLSIEANKIARAGEALLFIILIPYYITALLHYLLREDSETFAYVCVLITTTYGSVKYFKNKVFVPIIPILLLLLPQVLGDGNKIKCWQPLSLGTLGCYFSHKKPVVSPLESQSPNLGIGKGTQLRG